MYRDPVNDLRPSRFAFLFAHSGTFVEIVVPLVMLFSHGGTVSFVAVTIIVIFHLHIISNVPLAVPNEWNVYMLAAAIFLFWSHADVSVTDLSNPLLIALLAFGVMGPVVLGNLRPDLVSFVIAMRYYAGTWPASLWCFRGESWRRLSEDVTKASGLADEQLERVYGEDYCPGHPVQDECLPVVLPGRHGPQRTAPAGGGRRRGLRRHRRRDHRLGAQRLEHGRRSHAQRAAARGRPEAVWFRAR